MCAGKPPSPPLPPLFRPSLPPSRRVSSGLCNINQCDIISRHACVSPPPSGSVCCCHLLVFPLRRPTISLLPLERLEVFISWPPLPSAPCGIISIQSGLSTCFPPHLLRYSQTLAFGDAIHYPPFSSVLPHLNNPLFSLTQGPLISAVSQQLWPSCLQPDSRWKTGGLVEVLLWSLSPAVSQGAPSACLSSPSAPTPPKTPRPPPLPHKAAVSLQAT